MEQLFNIDFNRIHSSDEKEAAGRKKNFELFLKGGLPNKKDENWKFSDLNFIISKNFKNITNNDEYKFDEKIKLINDFEHNKIILVNGLFKSSDFKFSIFTFPLSSNCKSQDFNNPFTRITLLWSKS